jgi:hypothetical protein
VPIIMYRRCADVVSLLTAVLPNILASATAGLVVDHVMPIAAQTLEGVINNLTAWIVGILAAVATLFLTVGGVRYLTAGGDPSEVERAKSALRSALIGYALAILAPVLLTALQSILK